VPRGKIVDYLLSRSHPDGAGKAVFFRGYGFAPERWEQLRDALRAHAGEHPATEAARSEFGVRYVVDGALHTPDGRAPLVRSVWFIEVGEQAPRLVTAYPLRRETG
jgi:hypothetical protein